MVSKSSRSSAAYCCCIASDSEQPRNRGIWNSRRSFWRRWMDAIDALVASSKVVGNGGMTRRRLERLRHVSYRSPYTEMACHDSGLLPPFMTQLSRNIILSPNLKFVFIQHCTRGASGSSKFPLSCQPSLQNQTPICAYSPRRCVLHICRVQVCQVPRRYKDGSLTIHFLQTLTD